MNPSVSKLQTNSCETGLDVIPDVPRDRGLLGNYTTSIDTFGSGKFVGSEPRNCWSSRGGIHREFCHAQLMMDSEVSGLAVHLSHRTG